MRLFVAVDLPDDAVADLRAALAPVRAGWPTLRWGDPATWHLTLTFCGEVDERTADNLASRLERAARRHQPIDLAVAGAGAFPRATRAGVFWTGVTGEVDALRRLANSTSAAARRAGIAVDERRYRPHLTLARVSPPGDLRALVDALSSYAGPPWTAREIHLVRSRLGAGEGRRAAHDRLATFPLGGYQA